MRHTKTGKSLPYGDIAGFAKAPKTQPVIDEAELKDPKDFSIIGQNAAREDQLSKLDGSAKFVIDVTLPDMAFARIIRPPVKNAQAALYDETEISNLPVQVVPLPDGYGVVADNYEMAWYGAQLWTKTGLSIRPAYSPSPT